MNKLISKIALAFSMILTATQVAAETVVVVHVDNNSTFSADSIADIFLGKDKKFSDGVTAHAISPAEKGDSKQAFNKKVLKKSSSQLNAYWSKLIFTGKGRPPKAYDNEIEVKQQVADNVGYIGIIDASEVDDSVKVVYRF